MAGQKVNDKYFIPPMDDTVARDLTKEEARRWVIYYGAMDYFTILCGPRDLPLFDASGEPQLKKDDKVKVVLPEVAGLKLVPEDSSVKWRASHPLQQHMAALLFRFADFLQGGKWGATEIYWGGLGLGGTPHTEGRAMDFFGAMTVKGKFKVLDDWGRRKIGLTGGKKVGRWPDNTTKFSYRLEPEIFGTSMPEGTTPHQSAAAEFFQDVYDFLKSEARDQPGKTTKIGQASYIVTPDWPGSPVKREQHQNHIHFELPNIKE